MKIGKASAWKLQVEKEEEITQERTKPNKTLQRMWTSRAAKLCL